MDLYTTRQVGRNLDRAGGLLADALTEARYDATPVFLHALLRAQHAVNDATRLLDEASLPSLEAAHG